MNINNWQRIGIEKKEDVIKYILGYLLKHRKRILNHSLGAPYKSSKINNPGDPDLFNAAFIIGGRILTLTKEGWVF